MHQALALRKNQSHIGSWNWARIESQLQPPPPFSNQEETFNTNGQYNGNANSSLELKAHAQCTSISQMSAQFICPSHIFKDTSDICL